VADGAHYGDDCAAAGSGTENAVACTASGKQGELLLGDF